MREKSKSGFSENIVQLFSSGTVILFTCVPEGTFPLSWVSKNSKEILGFTPSYFLEHKNGWSNRIHPEDRERVFHCFQNVIDEGGGAINEYRFKRKDGDYVWLRDELKLIETGEEGPIIYGSSIEISDRKKVEIALKESQEQYQLVVDHIKDVTYSLDEQGCVLFLNKAWEERTGYSIAESKGKPFCDFIHAGDKENYRAMYNRLIEEQTGSETKIVRCLKKEGGFFWAEIYAKRLHNEADDDIITGTLIDVSREIARQQEIEAVNQRLEGRVKQRSEELEEEVERRKKAEKRLQQRLSYAKALSKCSNLLLESTSTEALRKSLKILQEVTSSDRVYLYKNREKEGELYLEPAMEITAEDVKASMGKPGEIRKYSLVPWWYEKLSKQQIIHAKVEDVPEPERSILNEQNVKSVLAIPIMANNEWYGYVGFAETGEGRVWHENEISLLSTAAGIIGGFLKRKFVEKSLVRQRNYTETILESLPSIYLLMDEQMQFVQWNKNAERYTGYSAEELQEKSAFDLIVPEEHEELKEATQRLREERTEGSELTLLTKSGERIPYFWRGYYITLDEQKYFLCVGLDITLQKQTERELTDEKRFNEALIESLPGIFYMIDSEGKYHRWNQNFVEELGYSPEELQHMGPVDVFDEHEYKRVEKEIIKVYEEGVSEIEAEVLTEDGSAIPYFFTGKLFSRDDEEYLVGVGHDISEQIEAREKLKKSEELFRNLFLKAPAAIVMVDPDNKVLGINKSFQELFGYTEEDLSGKDIDEVLVPEDEYDEAPKMPGKGYAMDSFHKEARRLSKDGTLIDVFVAAIPVHVDGAPLAGFGMYIDITEQKKYEEEIYNSLKEKHVLLQEIHHRVKNNLAVVSGLLQLQMYETDDPVIRETLEESESRIQTMALIHEKLYNSQNLSRISCASYIGDLVETIRNTIRAEKDISVATDIEDVDLNINKAVPFALLVNELVTNSFKHAFEDQKRGTITINLKQREGLLHAHISDDGKGLPDGFSPDRQDSLGMTLIQNFLKQLNADWEFGTDNGTYIDLTFQVDDVKGSSASEIIDL